MAEALETAAGTPEPEAKRGDRISYSWPDLIIPLVSLRHIPGVMRIKATPSRVYEAVLLGIINASLGALYGSQYV